MATPFREMLYRNYSANFGAGQRSGSVGEAELRMAYGLYRQAYSRCELPGNKDAKIADLGCGDGKWLSWLQHLGYRQLLGVDHSASEVARAQGLALEEGDMSEVLQRHPGEFDLVHLKDVIEHCTQQETVDLLAVCMAALKPGGQIWISTFNGIAPMAGVVHRGDFTHESAFSPGSLGQVLRACGFEVRQVVGAQVFSSGVKGMTRRCAAWIVQNVAGFVYFGQGHPFPGKEKIECATMKPGLVAVATRPVDEPRNP